MSFEREVRKRAEEKCEFCGHDEHLAMYVVPKTPEYIEGAETAVLACTTCNSQFDDDLTSLILDKTPEEAKEKQEAFIDLLKKNLKITKISEATYPHLRVEPQEHCNACCSL